ncbi:MAG: hypothetical protein FWG61_06595 [Firmicutes bacterium]|nr:hypothetical protein [Bacillota bacterium]
MRNSIAEETGISGEFYEWVSWLLIVTIIGIVQRYLNFKSKVIWTEKMNGKAGDDVQRIGIFYFSGTGMTRYVVEYSRLNFASSRLLNGILQ